ncbi:MAG: (2Fe-2S)-binding protein [Pseudomonadota bacterium]
MIGTPGQFDLVVLGTTQVARQTAEAAQGCGLKTKQINRSCEASAFLADPILAESEETVWSVIPAPGVGFRVDVIGGDGAKSFLTQRIAAEAVPIEIVVPFPGWALGGVMALGEGVRLVNRGKSARAILAGRGDAFWSGIASCLASGAVPTAVVCVDGGGASNDQVESTVRAELSGRHIPVYDDYRIIEAVGTDSVEGTLIAPNGTTWATPRALEADVIFVHDGLTWRDEIPRLLGAQMSFLSSGDGEAATCDAFGRTTVSGLYSIPREESRACALGTQVAKDAAEGTHWVTSNEFGAGDGDRLDVAKQPVWASELSDLPPDLQVCRFEPQTVGDLRKAIDAGAQDMNQLKQFTRMGMGVCQGRPCEEITARLMAQHLSVCRSDVGRWTMRPPLEMVDLSTLAGTFDYADIPIPRPAPL